MTESYFSRVPGVDWLRSWTAESDVRLLFVVSLALYLLFFAMSVILGLDFNGTISTLEQITFFSAVYAMAVLALNLQWGYAGMFNVGVAGFMAVGCYTLGVLTAPATGSPPGLGLPIPIGILGGMLMAGLFGALIAIPAIRLRADYLAIVTLAFAEIVRLTFRSTTLTEFSLLGVDLGFGGKTGVEEPPLLVNYILTENPQDILSDPSPIGQLYFDVFQTAGIENSVASALLYALILVIITGGFYWLLRRIGSSPYGRVLKAIREDEDVAMALGKNTRRFKIETFALGAALMALAGMLWFTSRGGIVPTNFRPETTFFVFVALIIGGSGSNTGSVLGGALFASLLYQGPNFVERIIGTHFDVGVAPETIFGAFQSFDAFFAYFLAPDVLNALRVVLIGVVLVLLIQYRPEGMLGDRKEIASSIDLNDRQRGGDTE